MEQIWSNWAAQVALQQKLPAGARIVLGRLAELADDVGRGVASNQWIIHLTGLSKNTVTRSFCTLQDQQILRRFPRYCGNLKQDSGFVLLESVLNQNREALRTSPKTAAGCAPKRKTGVDIDPLGRPDTAAIMAEKAKTANSTGLKNLLILLENSDNILNRAHYLSVLAHTLSNNCQLRFAGLVNTFRADWQMFANPTAPFAEVSSLSYELATQNLSKLTTATDPWGVLGAMLKNRLLQMRRQYWQNTRRTHSGDLSVLLQMSDTKSKFLPGKLGTPLVIVDEMPNVLAVIRLVTEAGADESMAFAVTKRVIEIAVMTPANLRPKIVGSDKLLASWGISSLVARAWNLFLVGGRGDSGVLGEENNPLTNRRLQNLLASLAAEKLLDRQGV